MQFSQYEVTWNQSDISIQDAVQRIESGLYPDDLSIFHPDFGTVYYSILGDRYLVQRLGPPVMGMRSGLARTFGNRQMGKEFLLEDINYIFPDIVSKVRKYKVAKQKLVQLQSEAARKLLRKSNRPVPRNIEQEIVEIIGEKKPVKGAFNVINSQAKVDTTLFTNGEVNIPRHLKKINTTLFTNKGGRRTKKSRQTRRKQKKRSAEKA